jgi:CheY-like chemotaxis protein/CRP-like cAMP-binding protein
MLVVEDNYLAAEDLCDLVRDHGFEVAAMVGTVEKALAAARHAAIDGAVLDLNLHGVQSFPVCTVLQERGIPFVIVTGYPETELPTDLRASGLLTKPIEPSALHSALDSMVAGYAAVRTGNALLDALGQPDRAELWPLMKPISLTPGKLLHGRRQPSEDVVFPVDALVSLTGESQGRAIEIGLIGFEGATGLASIFGARPAFDARVQIGGQGYRIDVRTLERRLSTSDALARHLLAYCHTMIGQAGEAVVAHGRGSINQRVARRLLMTQDRLRAPALALTHEELSSALGVRRASVTVALQILEGDGVIRASRKSIRILDRRRLMELVDGMYTPLARDLDEAMRWMMN